MKTIISVVSNYRYYIILVLSLVAAIGICGDVNDNLSISMWFIVVLVSKSVGFAAAYAVVKLVQAWDKAGSIPEYSKLLEDDED